MTGLALIHDGAPLAPHDLWSAWSLDPAVLVGLAAAAVLYARGMARLRIRSVRRRSARRWEALAFWSGWGTLVLALLSPLHPLGEALLWANMAQHELLMALAAPLLVLGRPLVVTLWCLPPRCALWALSTPSGRVRVGGFSLSTSPPPPGGSGIGARSHSPS